MNSGPDKHDMRQLQSLYELREQRALDAIAEQRIECDRVLRRLATQEALIQDLRNDLQVLRDMRSTGNLANMTAESFKAESDRRRWLVSDLELEVFYLAGFESDVDDARKEFGIRRRVWIQARDRIEALEQQVQKQAGRMRREDIRKSEAQLDDRFNIGIHGYG